MEGAFLAHLHQRRNKEQREKERKYVCELLFREMKILLISTRKMGNKYIIRRKA